MIPESILVTNPFFKAINVFLSASKTNSYIAQLATLVIIAELNVLGIKLATVFHANLGRISRMDTVLKSDLKA